MYQVKVVEADVRNATEQSDADGEEHMVKVSFVSVEGCACRYGRPKATSSC